ncbi:hypothetical protein XA68_12785 [Ophiocordyceps unilateralis]|uniref:polynucleotide adenylyltransferase n=1 Tax=Ophiocordyceps unilateralis TaxID=268505 RepID=A0A2A9PCG9_OPHUN|nr:hypothetical protein XA68_12785 [Ophiocordyceps unilateralis]
MPSQDLGPFDPAGGDPTASLESRIRSLVLAGNSPNDVPPQQHLQPDRPLTWSRPPPGLSTHHELSPKASKRRPNQAERRQMSSQLSIPIDPRPRQPSHQLNHSPGHTAPGNYAPGNYASRFDQRQPQAAWHSSWAGNGYPHFGNQFWNASSATAPVHYGHREMNNRTQFHSNQQAAQRSLYDPGSLHTQRRYYPITENFTSQARFLNKLCYQVVSQSEIGMPEIEGKEAFRRRIEAICRHVICRYEQEQQTKAVEFPALSIQLKCFGSLSSGFATKASDMDLGLLSPMSTLQPDAAESPIPRLLEKAFLDAGMGARLLGRARIPIIKLCELPPEPLRQSLVAERQKWESGDGNEAREVAGDEGGQKTPTRNPCVETSDHKASGMNLSSLAEANSEPGCHQLQQGVDNSLSSYYALAKRVLRRTEGRDATISNYNEFTDLDWSILDGVCEAFVQGLSDSLLRERLTRYPSLSFRPTGNMPSHRSLLGVYTQIEGEQLVQLWQAWKAKEALHSCQAQADQALSAWNDIQWRSNFGANPISYTRDLQLGLEKIKLVPSFQLFLLEQGQHEVPSQYYARAKAISASLRRGSSDSPSAVQQVLVDRYVSGIAQKDVRDILYKIVHSHNGQIDFEAVGLWHKCLHLSRQLEEARAKETVSASQAVDLTDYISLLQSPPYKILTGPAEYKFVIPVLPEAMDLVLRIRELHDLVTVSTQPRDRYRDPLEFPTTGAGVQCDINFSAHLALHNTALLRCYSYTDVRVRPMVLFVKHWAKVRGINSGYRGTLSSYGYVLMVLHYLVNVAKPFVCPNLQQLAPPPPLNPSPAEFEATMSCQGYDVQFWRNEHEIMHLATTNQLNGNRESIGYLLRGFFEYYAHTGMMSSGVAKGFDWGRDVLSLRTQGGLLTKQEKRWTGAKTVLEHRGASTKSFSKAKQASDPSRGAASDNQDRSGPSKRGVEVKEVRHRYLFAIEDPFELDHNVARTVTHNGIVSIRDEFRRAWRIIRTAEGECTQEDLLRDAKDAQEDENPFLKLMDDIHGPLQTWMAVDRAGERV